MIDAGDSAGSFERLRPNALKLNPDFNGEALTAHSLRAAILQFPVESDVTANLNPLAACIDRLHAGTHAVAPEGALSGYATEPGFEASLAGKLSCMQLIAPVRLT